MENHRPLLKTVALDGLNKMMHEPGTPRSTNLVVYAAAAAVAAAAAGSAAWGMGPAR